MTANAPRAMVSAGAMKRRRTRGLVRRGPGVLRAFARKRLVPKIVWDGLRRLVEGPAKKASRADELEGKLWGGFSEQALRDLAAIESNPKNPPGAVSDAARVLACWHASHENHEAALEHARLMRQRGPKKPPLLQVLLEADALMHTGQRERARSTLEAAIARKPHAALCLAMANTYAEPGGPISDEDDQRRLQWVNEVYRAHDLAPLEKLDTSRPLTLDNLGAPNAPAVSSVDAPKISVIVPAHDSASVLHVALGSLLRQTWTNLEVIVVDDQSNDETCEVAERFSRDDSRVVLLRQPRNRGAYAARNSGLKHATGTFVTVHDADDWSHPEKLEQQVRQLLESPHVLANLSLWSRCLEHLYFRGATRASRPWVHYNYSSLMLKRELLLALGGWDEVRVGADSELLQRLRHGQRQERVERVLPGAPLAFARSAPTSLTRQSLTHAHTLLHGVRRTYREASLHWLEKQPPEPAVLRGQGRAFPAPSIILPERASDVALDALFVLDFNQSGPCYERAITQIRTLANQGAQLGVFQWGLYAGDPTRRMSAEILELAARGRVDVVSAGEIVRAETVYVVDPKVLLHAIDRPPEVTAQRVVFVEPEGSAMAPADRERASQAARQAFGTEVT